ncbi:ABC transporter substrate-binding protein [Cochlodiniinecator piscidefendens]|uniref:ABC transporter substrate-binding protein n=1 Tax=Cochlodiniinecator piscidefendens TaxID=2715756 RepID=UPI00140A1E9B|nr:ABC transporter substrate-binding protein [Cochlodiniinecator piscidefendens]
MSDDKFNDYLFKQYVANKISRRRFMGTLAAAGASATVISGLAAGKAKASQPKRGGRLVIGAEASQAQDSLDPTKYFSTSNILMGYAVYDNLVNRDENLLAKPWLATSWEPNADSSQWVFNLREGVTFHDGSDFGADDVIYSMTRHFREGSEAPSKSFMSQIASIDKLGPLQVRFNLNAPHSDFPMLLSDTRVHVTKDGVEDFTGTPVGTGPFKVVEFTPGNRYVFARNDDYWGDDGPYVDELEVIGIGDNTARINALIAGDINAMIQLDQKAYRLIENSGVTYPINAPSGAFINLAMMMDRAPTESNDVRLALKYAIDRQGVVDNVLKGLGSVGNDHPLSPIDPYYNADIPQREYDPERARFHIRQAGLENTPIEIYGSDVAGTGALAAAQHLEQSAQAAGINLSVINPPADSFWSAVWIQKPIITSGWDPRPIPDLIFSIAFSNTSGWNETKWDNENFQRLLIEARSENDFDRRKEMYGEMQVMLQDDGGHATLGFRNFVDAARSEVQGITPSGAGPLGFYQGARTAWIDE